MCLCILRFRVGKIERSVILMCNDNDDTLTSLELMRVWKGWFNDVASWHNSHTFRFTGLLYE